MPCQLKNPTGRQAYVKFVQETERYTGPGIPIQGDPKQSGNFEINSIFTRITCRDIINIFHQIKNLNILYIEWF